MPKFLFRSSYTPEGLEGLIREGGSSRRAATAAAIESVGGSLESFHFAFGDADVFIVCDLPDEASAAALSMLVNSSGAIRGTMIPLMTAEDLDRAAALSPSFRPPGTGT
jgi:uncharacterized protein with GYD domain